MTFLVISESGGVVYGVPSVVVPELVVKDVRGLFSEMIAVTRDSNSLPKEMDEQALVQLVWEESFTSFLTDVDFLFEWLSDGQGSTSLIMDVFVNMLRQCCCHGAWEFGAYMVNKASECGVKIVSNVQEQNVPFTAETLKASVKNNHADLDNAHTLDFTDGEMSVCWAVC